MSVSSMSRVTSRIATEHSPRNSPRSPPSHSLKVTASRSDTLKNRNVSSHSGLFVLSTGTCVTNFCPDVAATHTGVGCLALSPLRTLTALFTVTRKMPTRSSTLASDNMPSSSLSSSENIGTLSGLATEVIPDRLVLGLPTFMGTYSRSMATVGVSGLGSGIFAFASCSSRSLASFSLYRFIASEYSLFMRSMSAAVARLSGTGSSGSSSWYGVGSSMGRYRFAVFPSRLGSQRSRMGISHRPSSRMFIVSSTHRRVLSALARK
mmetsp:Transcript_5590/g.15022  ORF Transcript_5590/g.15022 Transcript_5590/m.15022 type:complete len:264 (+) Transcript_5590:161-952(+)